MNDYNEVFEYRDGELFWKIKPSGVTNKGDKAGSMHKDGYLHVQYKGRKRLNHRVIYEMFHGPIPNGMQIDHIDHDRTNNQIENLRTATNSQNHQNRENALGFSYVKESTYKNPKWVAYIKLDQKHNYLGTFYNVVDARAAYLSAKRELHISKEFRNGI